MLTCPHPAYRTHHSHTTQSHCQPCPRPVLRSHSLHPTLPWPRLRPALISVTSRSSQIAPQLAASGSGCCASPAPQTQAASAQTPPSARWCKIMQCAPQGMLFDSHFVPLQMFSKGPSTQGRAVSPTMHKGPLHPLRTQSVPTLSKGARATHPPRYRLVHKLGEHASARASVNPCAGRAAAPLSPVTQGHQASLRPPLALCLPAGRRPPAAGVRM